MTTTKKKFAASAGIASSTFSRCWKSGAGKRNAVKIAELLSLHWTRVTAGQRVDTYVSAESVIRREGFRVQVLKICPGLHLGGGRPIKDKGGNNA